MTVTAAPACGVERGTLRERWEQRQQRQPPAAAAEEIPGTTRHAVVVNGLERTYYLSVPAGGASRPLPLVLVFHGGHSDPQRIAATTELHRLGGRAGFMVAYPAAIEKDRVWNDGRATTASPIDDVAFVDAMIADINTRHPIDRGRIYATGASNGGMFTLRLACERADVIRAFAPVVANLPADLLARCRPGRPVPILFIHGTEDRMMPWGGGEVAGSRLLGRGKGDVISATDTVQFWARHNACSPAAVSERLPDVADDGTRVEVVRLRDCQAGAAVIQYRIEGGGHTWPGSAVAPTLRMAGVTSQDINASEVILQFFSQH